MALQCAVFAEARDLIKTCLLMTESIDSCLEMSDYWLMPIHPECAVLGGL